MVSLITACPKDVSEHSLIPYSIDSLVALHSYWHVPYSYVPSFGLSSEVSMAFSPLLHDPNWKGNLTLTAVPIYLTGTDSISQGFFKP